MAWFSEGVRTSSLVKRARGASDRRACGQGFVGVDLLEQGHSRKMVSDLAQSGVF